MTLLGKGLLPDIEAKCGCHKWTLQHDGAPAHTARNTMEYLEKEKIDFIEPDIWLPNNPDLNLVDYAVWGPSVASLRCQEWRWAYRTLQFR